MTPARAPLILALVLPAFGQYAGPAILSRGEAPAAMAAPKIDFRPSVAVGVGYSTGLAGVAVVDQQGDLANASAYSVNVSVGISGVHSWRHTLLGINYGASFSHYNTNSFYDYINQSLGLGITHQISRHVGFSLHESTGMFSRVNPSAGLSETVPFDPSTTYIPVTDFYDNRTIYSTTGVGLTFQKSSRLSFSTSGGLFTNIRRSKALYGVVGLNAGGDVQYRLSRRTTIGANYSFNYYHFTGIVSSSFMHGGAVTFAARLSRLVEFTGYGGFQRAETKFIQSVPVDPAIQALLGIKTTTVLDHRVYYVPNFGGRLSHTFNHGVAYITVGEGITPGNGLFLTSRTLAVSAGYGYTGLRRWSLNVSSGYTKALSEANIQGDYGSIYGSFGMSRQLMHNISFYAAFTANQYRSSSFTRYNRLIYSASAGLAWSPGDIPLRMW